jgi:hypothetical protein
MMAKTADGRLLIRVPSGVNQCIQRTDTILMTAPKVILTKNGGLLRKDEEAGVYFKTTFDGTLVKNGNIQAAEPFTRDNVAIVSVKDYETGQIILPIVSNVIDLLSLKNGDATITKVQIKMYLLKKKGNTGFGFVIKNLADFSNKFPFPPNPLGEGLHAVANLTSSLLSDDNNKDNNVAQKAATADITLNFSPTSNCDANTAETGVYAVVSRSTRTAIPGYIDIGANNFDDYCFGVQNAPVSALLVGRRSAAGGGQCTPDRFVDNDYIMFMLTKYSIDEGRLEASFPAPDPSFSITSVGLASTTSTAAINTGREGPTFGRRAGMLAVRRPSPILAKVNSIDTLSIIRSYPWYSSLKPDFQHRLQQAVSDPHALSKDKADDVLALDYVKTVVLCSLAGAKASQCALPVPPARTME